MPYRDILTPVIELDQDEAALAVTAELAAKFGAHAAVLIVAVHLSSDFQRSSHTLSEVLRDLAAGSRSHAAMLREGIVAWLKRAGHEFEIRDVSIEGAVHEDQVVAHARVADLIVMTRGARGDAARNAMTEDILFKSGRPVLLVPAKQVAPRKWDRFVIGWNARAEAVRAVQGAMPLLEAASQVVVATVNAAPSKSGHAEGPGHDLATHLARHGVRVDVRNLDSGGHSEGKALLDEALAFGADALIMGGYGHSRARETLFGGVTRELLLNAPIPLLMAH